MILMKEECKRIAAIHDLACFGRSSLTAIMPTLSAMGFQVCPLPTALLSTHTSEFPGFHFRDLSDDMESIIDHWKHLEVDFTAIYSGFLGSEAQAEVVAEFINDFRRPDQLIIVDPVLGDEGELYPTISNSMIAKMRFLTANADLVTPNPTEAALLLGAKPTSGASPIRKLKEQARDLAGMGSRWVVITGALIDGCDCRASLLYEARNERFWLSETSSIPAYFPGTGDIFAALMCGFILSGDSPALALGRSTGILEKMIKGSHSYNYPFREGVLLEKFLADGSLQNHQISLKALL